MSPDSSDWDIKANRSRNIPIISGASFCSSRMFIKAFVSGMHEVPNRAMYAQAPIIPDCTRNAMVTL